MRGAIRLALCLLGLVPARADDDRRSRLLVAYVAGRDAVSEKRIGPVLAADATSERSVASGWRTSWMKTHE